MQDLLNYYFWFSQPSEALGRVDKLLGYGFAALLVVAIAFYVLARFVSSPVGKKPVNRLANLSLSVGLMGLVWFGFRYENTPIFAQRYWAALSLLIGLIWLGFIVKYLIVNFGRERSEFAREQLKQKYIPGNK